MRCYHLCNMYLIQIHAGIQAAHAQHELAIKYLTNDSPTEPHLVAAEGGYTKWATEHKTMVLLNGGMAKDLLEFESFLQSQDHGYAWASFREEEAAINGAITNVAIVLPEKMYTKARDIIKIADKYDSRRRFIDIPGFAHGEVFIHIAGSEPDGAVVSVIMYDEQGHAYSWRYNEFEYTLLKAIARCDLMR